MGINQPLRSLNVYLGRHFRSSGGTKYRVSKATFHPGWEEYKAGKSPDKGMLPFDLLLLRLDQAVTFSTTINPVCLPIGPQDSPSPGTEVLASGWGHDVPFDVDLGKGALPNELQFIWQKVISLKDCNELAFKSANDEKCTMVNMNEEIQVTSNVTLCVNSPGNPKIGAEKGELHSIDYNIYKSLCLGDSGGPLVALKDNRFTLVGVTSWGLWCSMQDTPGGYTDVAKSMTWIKEVMGK